MSKNLNSLNNSTQKENCIQKTVNSIYHTYNNDININVKVKNKKIPSKNQSANALKIIEQKLENESMNKNINFEKLSNDIPSKYFYINSSNNLNSYSNQEFIKNINYDSSEVIVKCKPMITSTASKTFMKEYSISKRYEEDKLSLFSSIEKNEIVSKKSTDNENEDNMGDLKEDYLFNEIIEYQESILPVPIEQKNNERFKILKIKEMKRLSMPPNKSVKRYEEDMETKYEKEFRINNEFSTMKKKKPVHSLKRIYSSCIFFNKNKKEKKAFMIFRDKDIGVYEYWQAHIHESHIDEDIETDEKQKIVASNFSISEIKQAFDFIKKNGSKSFINFHKYKNYYINNETEKIIDEIIYNLDNYQLSNTQSLENKDN